MKANRDHIESLEYVAMQEQMDEEDLGLYENDNSGLDMLGEAENL